MVIQSVAVCVVNMYQRVIEQVNQWLVPLWLLAIRFWVGSDFFRSGLTKINDWSTTLLLFENEYHVPLLPFELAAYLGTAGELVFPVLLIAGLGGRFAAVGLFMVNVMAVVSYPGIADAALLQHYYWGALFAGLAVLGMGRVSLDAWIAPRVARCATKC